MQVYAGFQANAQKISFRKSFHGVSSVKQQTGRIPKHATSKNVLSVACQAASRKPRAISLISTPISRPSRRTAGALKAVGTDAVPAELEGKERTNAVKALGEKLFEDNRPVAKDADTPVGSQNETQERLSLGARQAVVLLGEGLLERETEVALMVLASLCGEHLLLLGPPGTAKSEVARRLSGLVGGDYFERLLTRFTVPEELFGPLSLQALEQDKYERQMSGYLPSSEVAFVDEIFKANSAILNSMLTLLNERCFDNGTTRIDVPLLTLVGASNEPPESDELMALHDRFLLRRHVAPVSAGGLRQLAVMAAEGFTERSGAKSDEDENIRKNPLSMEDFRACRKLAKKAVAVPDVVIDLMVDLKVHLAEKCEPPITVSDRRFTQVITLLQVAAYLNGASEVTPYDCLLLEHCLTSREGEERQVTDFVVNTIISDAGLLQAELGFLGLYGQACRALREGNSDSVAQVGVELSDLQRMLWDKWASLQALLAEGEGGLAHQLQGNVWVSPAKSAALILQFTPALEKNLETAAALLTEMHTLEAALSADMVEDHPDMFLEKLLPKRKRQYEKGIGSLA